jgi:hypothetical protein
MEINDLRKFVRLPPSSLASAAQILTDKPAGRLATKP